MKPGYFLIFLVSLNTTGCAGLGDVLAGAASGNPPQCPQPITTPTTVGCVGGSCAVTTYPAAHVAGCP
jgi:hypothetical protein